MGTNKKSDHFTVVEHPLIRHKLTLMRKVDTKPSDFRRLLREIASLLTIEVTKDVPVDEVHIDTPLCQTLGWQLQSPVPVVVPILRAGLGMADGVLDVMTEADIGHIGVFRDEKTLRPVEYVVRLPKHLNNRTIIVVDPMLATGYSCSYAIDVLIENGAKAENIVFMALVAAPEGVKVLTDKHPKVRIVSAALDSHLDKKSFIVPGLGDAGDRVFGTL
jgi:uracil phosphoribosyltransferase